MEFLREIRDIAKVQRNQSHDRSVSPHCRDPLPRPSIDEEAVEDGSVGDGDDEGDEEGVWVPGQGVFVDHAAIVEIMIHHLSYPGQWQLVLSITPLMIIKMSKFKRSQCTGSRLS